MSTTSSVGKGTPPPQVALAVNVEQVSKHVQGLPQRFSGAAARAGAGFDAQDWDADVCSVEVRDTLAPLRARLRSVFVSMSVMTPMHAVMHERDTAAAFSQDERTALHTRYEELRREQQALLQAVEAKRSVYLLVLRPIAVTCHCWDAFYEAADAAVPGCMESPGDFMRTAVAVHAVIVERQEDLKKQVTMLDSVTWDPVEEK